jgi:hypothetical protein
MAGKRSNRVALIVVLSIAGASVLIFLAIIFTSLDAAGAFGGRRVETTGVVVDKDNWVSNENSPDRRRETWVTEFELDDGETGTYAGKDVYDRFDVGDRVRIVFSVGLTSRRVVSVEPAE